MKKALVPIVILLLLAGVGAGLYLSKKGGLPASLARTLGLPATASGLDPAALLPGSTLGYFELNDLDRTRERWTKSALYALYQEPEIQNFLKMPLSKLPASPQYKEANDWFARFQQVHPQQGFLAVTALPEGTGDPKVLAGFSYQGTRAELDALLTEPRQKFRESQPTGQADLVKQGNTEIQTFTAEGKTMAEAMKDNWYFISNDLATLQAVLAGYDNKKTVGDASLAKDEIFRSSRQPLPADPEGSFYVRLEPLMAKILPLLSASGQQMDAETMESLKRQKAITAAVRLQGTDFEETFFSYAPGTPEQPKLNMPTMALTTPETLFYYSALMPKGSATQLQAIAPMLGENGALAIEVLKALGQTISVALEWGTGPTPDALLAAELTPGNTTLQPLLEKTLAAPMWARSVLAGAKAVYTTTQNPMANVAGSVALSDQYLLGGTAVGVQNALERAKAPTTAGHLGSSPTFQAAAKGVPVPGDVFAYMNTGAIINKAYGLARPMLTLAIAFNPQASPYVDASKLPSVDVLSKHFGAAALSRSSTKDGQLTVSKGPVTIMQTVFGLGVAGGITAAAFKDQFSAAAGALGAPLPGAAPGAAPEPPEAPAVPEAAGQPSPANP